jgi:hypothetical protein
MAKTRDIGDMCKMVGEAVQMYIWHSESPKVRTRYSKPHRRPKLNDVFHFFPVTFADGFAEQLGMGPLCHTTVFPDCCPRIVETSLVHILVRLYC